jgi:hypothetical protein
LTSMDSKKLAALPSSNQQGTWRVSDATTTATSRNAPSTLAISFSVVSRTRKDYTSSAPLGRSLHSCKDDRAGLLPPPDTSRRRCQQLVERRPALSILRLVYTTTPGLKSTRLHQDPSAVSGLRVLAPVFGLLLRCKRPPGPGTSLWTTPLQDPARAATYGSWAATSVKGL